VVAPSGALYPWPSQGYVRIDFLINPPTFKNLTMDTLNYLASALKSAPQTSEVLSYLESEYAKYMKSYVVPLLNLLSVHYDSHGDLDTTRRLSKGYDSTMRSFVDSSLYEYDNLTQFIASVELPLVSEVTITSEAGITSSMKGYTESNRLSCLDVFYITFKTMNSYSYVSFVSGHLTLHASLVEREPERSSFSVPVPDTSSEVSRYLMVVYPVDGSQVAVPREHFKHIEKVSLYDTLDESDAPDTTVFMRFDTREHAAEFVRDQEEDCTIRTDLVKKEWHRLMRTLRKCKRSPLA
jgi:hypothetical protein